MTVLAQAHQIAEIVRSTIRQRHDVMYLLRRRRAAVFQTLFAERMRFDVQRADFTPPRVVSFFGLRVAAVVFVFAPRL